MKRLARLFSALALYALLVAAAALIWLRPAPPPPAAVPLVAVERIVIEKAARQMLVYQDGAPVRRFRIALGSSPLGDKTRQGDGRTPEGLFHVNRRNAASAFHLSLGLDYPRPADLDRARAAGVDPGGDIMIHGQPNQMPAGTVIARDWTAGCIALSDAEMDEVFAATALGTPVLVKP